MTDTARATILARIRASLGRGELGGNARAQAEARLAQPKPNLIPARAQLPHEQKIELFRRLVHEVNATTERIAHWSGLAHSVAAYLAENDLPRTVRIAPHPRLKDVPWSQQIAIATDFGKAQAADLVGVTLAVAGIAESGTLALRSGPQTPTTLNFLPDIHIITVATQDILGTYEDFWASERKRGPQFMPRTINWVTGPSRTADIEQTLLLGVHGPRRLHIVLVDESVGE